jgi:hypothetical protein
MVSIIAAIGIVLFLRRRNVVSSSEKSVSTIHEIDGAEIPGELPATYNPEHVEADTTLYEMYSPIAPREQREEYGYSEQSVYMPDGLQVTRLEPGQVSPLESAWSDIVR